MLDTVARAGKPIERRAARGRGRGVAAFQPRRRTHGARAPARPLPFPRHAHLLSRPGASGARHALSAIGGRRPLSRRSCRALDHRRSAQRGARDHPGGHDRASDSSLPASNKRTRIEIGDHAFLAMTPDPLVLFPGAEISCATEVTLAASGCAILIDGLSHHDPEGFGPEGSGRPFDRYSNAVSCAMPPAVFCSTTAARSPAKRCLLHRPRSAPIARSERSLCSATARNAAMRSFLNKRLAACGCVAGFSKLPNDAGIGSRVLAANGGALARGLEAAFAVAFEALDRACRRRAGVNSSLIQRTPKPPSLDRRPSAARLPLTHSRENRQIRRAQLSSHSRSILLACTANVASLIAWPLDSARRPPGSTRWLHSLIRGESSRNGKLSASERRRMDCRVKPAQ